MKDENGDVRIYAAKVLGDIGDAKAADPLIQALKDEEKYVQYAAEKALEKIKKD